MKSVIVLGAGVAGLTVAHELVNRGFNVTVYECRKRGGGKSRSYPAKRLLDADGGRVSGFDNLKGEHGFRFFPGFYRHLDDTMGQIPVAPAFRKEGRETVLDCLTPIREELLAVGGHPPIAVPASTPLTIKDIRNALRLPGNLADVGLTDGDLSAFSDKLWQIATSCTERRDEEYEKIGWRDFVDSKNRSDEYYWYLASGLTRALVAARARYASTKTMGNIALRLLTVALDVGQSTDRVLCGPTNDVWIDPWIRYIEDPARRTRNGKKKGDVTFEWQTQVTNIVIQKGRVAHVRVQRMAEGQPDGEPADKEADYFVSALPVEALAELVRRCSDLATHPQFRDVISIADATGSDQCLRRMSGLQIYCRKKLDLRPGQPLNKGHQLFLDSPWGLTSIDQGQFWDALPSGVGAILSIDISSWDMKGINTPKTASQCADAGALEVFEEVFAQVSAGLGDGLLTRDNIIGWHLDGSKEKLLVNRVDSWRLRPTPGTPFDNFKVAGDFVQTMTDLACMEGANEAARVAVNEILAQEGWPLEDQCPVWAAHEPMLFRPLQEMDRYRYQRGLPWSGAEVGKWLVRGAQTVAAAANPLGTETIPVATEDVPTSMYGQAQRLPRSEWDDGPPQMPVEALTFDQVATELKGYDRFATPGRSDPMFKRWRLFKRKEAPQYLVPLHIYDADSVIVYGRARNFEYLEKLTKDTGYFPVSCDTEGERFGFAELWIIRYNDTSMGPCLEVAINFVVSRDKDKPGYGWRSPYSALVPMMDPGNRLFTPILLLHETGKPGCIEYGNKIFGMNKLRGKLVIESGPIWTIKAHQLEERLDDGSIAPCQEALAFSMKIDVRTTRLDTAASGIEFARELGPVAAARNWRQIADNDEIKGGLVTKDFRVSGATKSVVPTVDIPAAYKFAPNICRLDDDAPLQLGTSQFAEVLKDMRFEQAIAAYEPHLKSVLYTDDCPTPDD